MTEQDRPRIFGSKDILESADASEALGIYHLARQERYGELSYTLMMAMGKKLLDLGDLQGALQWTMLSEQTKNNQELEKMVAPMYEAAAKIESASHRILEASERMFRLRF